MCDCFFLRNIKLIFPYFNNNVVAPLAIRLKLYIVHSVSSPYDLLITQRTNIIQNLILFFLNISIIDRFDFYWFNWERLRNAIIWFKIKRNPNETFSLKFPSNHARLFLFNHIKIYTRPQWNRIEIIFLMLSRRLNKNDQISNTDLFRVVFFSLFFPLLIAVCNRSDNLFKKLKLKWKQKVLVSAKPL